MPLVLVGPTAQWAHELPGVTLTGAVSDDELAAIYTGAHALVFPSDDEGFGLPPVEALACGTPVAASDVPALREVLDGRATLSAVDDLDGLDRRGRIGRAPRPTASRLDLGGRRARHLAGLPRGGRARPAPARSRDRNIGPRRWLKTRDVDPPSHAARRGRAAAGRPRPGFRPGARAARPRPGGPRPQAGPRRPRDREAGPVRTGRRPHAGPGRRPLRPGLPHAARRRARAPSPSRKPKPKPQKTVLSELTRLLKAGAITSAQYGTYSASFNAALATQRHLHGTPATELEAVIENLHSIAAAGKLTPGRLPVLFQTLDYNRQWWASGTVPSASSYVEFTGSELVWEYYPGQGIELQVLATFGKADGLYTAGPSDYPQMEALLAQMIPLAVNRGGGLVWEYYFQFGGGKPPWTSAMSQGTGIEALTRAYLASNDPSYLQLAHQALAAVHRAAADRRARAHRRWAPATCSTRSPRAPRSSTPSSSR